MSSFAENTTTAELTTTTPTTTTPTTTTPVPRKIGNNSLIQSKQVATAL